MARLVVIDGLDGSGKTTQFERLGEYLSSQGTSYRQICFPDYREPSSALVKMYLAGDFGVPRLGKCLCGVLLLRGRQVCKL